ERGRFAEYAAAGINRISLGAQSFDDALLRRIGRIHSAAETGQAIEELAAAGIGNFNLDIMYGLPGQTAASALDDLEQAIAHAPPHLSWYELTLEPGTAFYRRPPRLPPERDMLEMEANGRECLAAAGFERYEISAYARAGARCRHNENYWGYGDYLGVGPGAHGKRSRGERIWRSERIHSPMRWLRQAGAPEAVSLNEVPHSERPFEYVLNALRCMRGFDWPVFEARTGLPREVIARPVAAAVADGLLETAGERVWPSDRGLRYLNDLQARFLPV
ncbi:MAG: radical SAM family heme chaperone HemW, partial [Terriglobia bacterium]